MNVVLQRDICKERNVFLFVSHLFPHDFLVKENGESESPSNYPTVSNIAKSDILSSPSNGTSESNYQKRWQHWQQHQFMSGELLKTSSKVRLISQQRSMFLCCNDELLQDF